MRPPLFDVSSYILLEMNLASRSAPAAAELLLHFVACFDSPLPFTALPHPEVRVADAVGGRAGLPQLAKRTSPITQDQALSFEAATAELP